MIRDGTGRVEELAFTLLDVGQSRDEATIRSQTTVLNECLSLGLCMSCCGVAPILEQSDVSAKSRLSEDE